jgi:hypothetical protein
MIERIPSGHRAMANQHIESQPQPRERICTCTLTTIVCALVDRWMVCSNRQFAYILSSLSAKE